MVIGVGVTRIEVGIGVAGGIGGVIGGAGGVGGQGKITGVGFGYQGRTADMWA